jgi:hypothetical protein
LDKNNYLYRKNGEKKINDNALVALAFLIAESDPKEKDVLIKPSKHFKSVSVCLLSVQICVCCLYTDKHRSLDRLGTGFLQIYTD